LFSEGNELAYGFIEPLYSVIYSKLNARKGVSQAAWRAGNDLLIGKVGDKPDNRVGYAGHKSTTDAIDKLGNELEDIRARHKVVIPYWVDISKISPSPVSDYTPMLELFDTSICGGFGIPKVMALGEGKIGKGDLEINVMRDLDRRLLEMQNNLSEVLMTTVFNKLLVQSGISKFDYQIKWKEITPADMNRKAKRIQYWIEAGILTPQDVRQMVLDEEGLLTSEMKKELSGQGSESLKNKRDDK